MTAGIHKIYREDNQPFTMVPNELVRDPEVTPNAFRLLAYLMSHQDGYEITYAQIERQTTLKRWAINAAIELLTDKGYLEVRRTKKSNGQWGPKDWIIKDPATVGHSTVEPSHVGPTHSGTVNGHKKNTNKEKQLVKKKTIIRAEDFVLSDQLRGSMEETYPALILDDEVTAFIDHHTSKGSTFKNWDAAFRTWCRNANKWSPQVRKTRQEQIAEQNKRVFDKFIEGGN